MMKRFCAFVGAAALVTQPVVAAGYSQHSAYSAQRPAAFGGISVRVPLGAERAKPQARLQLTTYRMDRSRPGATRKFSGNGLELGLVRGKPMLFSGGRSSAEIKDKLGIDTTTVVIVGGVVLIVAVVALAASAGGGLGDTCGEYEGNDDHCID